MWSSRLSISDKAVSNDEFVESDDSSATEDIHAGTPWPAQVTHTDSELCIIVPNKDHTLVTCEF